MIVTGLRCEYLRNPLAIDASSPRLSWRLESARRGERQTAYQIRVASTPWQLAAGVGDRWDSGRVTSDRSIQIEYAGVPLRSMEACYWSVRAWDVEGQPSEWAAPATWTMGLLHASDWREAQWIGVDEHVPPDRLATPRYLRQTFTIRPGVRRAIAHATALGVYELRLDGGRIGEHVLAPEWTNYAKRVQYQAYDLTASLTPGEHCLAAILGDGWYSGLWQNWPPKNHLYGTHPQLLLRLKIEYDDGSTQRIISDENWRATAEGPLQFAGLYEGETYDATRAFAGWDTPAFDDRDWCRAAAASGLNVGVLVAQRSEPIRVTQELPAIAITEPSPGVYVFDFGQNMVGRCRLKPTEPAGTTLTLTHNEVLAADGRVYRENLHAGRLSTGDRQIVRYTCDGAVEAWEPTFASMGFRYVEVHGLSRPPTPDMLTGRVLHTGFERTGRFACSNPLLTRLAENIQWSQRGNMAGVPTDCPARDERCGYTGDAQFFMPTAVYNFDVAAFFNKWLVDVCQDAQRPEGYFADHAPDYGAGKTENVGWSDAGIICPYWIWQTYGDTRVLSDHYEAMKRYLQRIEQTSTAGLRDPAIVGIGDWLNLGGGASKGVIGTAYAAGNFRMMADIAATLGRQDDADEFAAHADRIAAAFVKAFVTLDGRLIDCGQTGYALAYTFGLIPPARHADVAKQFAAEIDRSGGHVTTGFIGTPRLLPALHAAGRHDLAYQLLLRETFPSWLYPVTLGATTIWERWDGWTPEKGFADPAMNSFNHYAFGSVGHYLFACVAGIRALEPGYGRIAIAPVIERGLTWASATFDCMHGRIESAWETSGRRLSLRVAVPSNTRAVVTLPATADAVVLEDGRPLSDHPDVALRVRDGSSVTCEVGAGTYAFEIAEVD